MKRPLTGLLILLLATGADADVFQPAYLELREAGNGEYEVMWKVPVLGEEFRLSAYVVFPEDAKRLTEPRVVTSGGAWIERWRVRREGGLAGETIAIEGNAAGVTDVIARVERLDGTSQVERLQAGAPRFVVLPPTGTTEVAWSYLVLGVEHILGGVDHLLFVLALLLIVHDARRIVATVTAFTAAHTITLAAATLGWLRIPGPPVEAIIALSVVFVASEVVHGLRGRKGLTAQAPWVVAFSFGLLHGLGFAGALAEVGLPQKAIPLALLMFNVGVELGQLAFVAAVLGAAALLGRLIAVRPVWTAGAIAYGIGAVAAFWTVERVASFWP
jgi:hydrogenase/urease accessory protein HupE